MDYPMSMSVPKSSGKLAPSPSPSRAILSAIALNAAAKSITLPAFNPGVNSGFNSGATIKPAFAG
jgi:hypothetical protein